VIAPIEDEDVPLGVEGHSYGFRQPDVGGNFEKVLDEAKRNLPRHVARVLSAERNGRQQDGENYAESHHVSPSRLDAFTWLRSLQPLTEPTVAKLLTGERDVN